MKKLKMTVLAIVASVSLFSFQTPSEAASTTHTVSTGESLWKVANRYGISIVDLKAANKQTSNLIFVGQKLVIPNSFISAADKELMARLVSAEAKGESYAGKVAVATVILNRLSHPIFLIPLRESFIKLSLDIMLSPLYKMVQLIKQQMQILKRLLTRH